MKKLILLSSIWLFTANAFASHSVLQAYYSSVGLSSTDYTLSGKDTHFNELLDMFDKAPIAEKKDVIGWNSGRCFLSTEQNFAKPQILIGEERLVGTNKGPLFPAQKEFKIISIEKADPMADADSLDAPSSTDYDEIHELVDTVFPLITIATEVNGSLVSQNEGLAYETRHYGNYIITKNTVLKGNDTYKTGDIYGMCYFFNKIPSKK